MRTKLLLAAVCILTLPLWFSTSPSDKPENAAPLAIVAYAGHTTTGDWCECGSPGCIPDLGEICGNNNARAADDQNDSAPSDSRAGSDIDPGAGVLMLALSFFLWTRLRA